MRADRQLWGQSRPIDYFLQESASPSAESPHRNQSTGYWQKQRFDLLWPLPAETEPALRGLRDMVGEVATLAGDREERARRLVALRHNEAGTAAEFCGTFGCRLLGFSLARNAKPGVILRAASRVAAPALPDRRQ